MREVQRQRNGDAVEFRELMIGPFEGAEQGAMDHHWPTDGAVLADEVEVEAQRQLEVELDGRALVLAPNVAVSANCELKGPYPKASTTWMSIFGP